MKKTVHIFLVLIIMTLTFLSACTNNIDLVNKPYSSNQLSETDKKVSDSLQDQPGSNVTTQKDDNSISSKSKENGVGGAVIRPQKYRIAFYSVPGPFIKLVDREDFFEWRETVDDTSEAETMVMKLFIQHYNISREDFDKANTEWAKFIKNEFSEKPCLNPKDFANQEDDEIYNADIVYSFDDSVINNYYLSPDYPYIYEYEFNEAVEAGEYTSRTEQWIDVDKMEADIIAKYGSID